MAALNIKNPKTDRLAHQVAEEAGETLTEAVTVALEQRLVRLRRQTQVDQVMHEVRRVQDLLRSLPDLDTRSADEILGYDDRGLPG